MKSEPIPARFSPGKRFTIPNLRWVVLALLFLVTVLNYVDRQTLSVLAPFLRDELHMTNQDYALIVSAFLVSYTIMQAVSGIVIDRVGTRCAFALMFVWWSLATILHRWARGVRSLAVFRFLLGVGEAGNWPGAIKAIAEWFPLRERAFATGIFNAGSGTGALIAPPLIAYVTLHYGWRDAFVVIGLIGSVWLLAWLILYRRPEEHRSIGSDELALIVNDSNRQVDPQSHRISWFQLLSLREVWGIILARWLTDPVWWFYVFWLPEYLKRERGFTLATIGFLAWVPFLAADVGCILGGWTSDYFIRHGRSIDSARKIVLAFSALLTIDALLVVQTKDSSLALVLISIAVFGVQSWGTLLLAIPADLFPSNVVASVSGLSGMGAGLGGVLFTLLTGYLLDHFSYKPVLGLAAALHPVGFIVLLLTIPNIGQRQRNGATTELRRNSTRTLGQPR
jgi:MFS transporter, ACS family, hexuronate transporter